MRCQLRSVHRHAVSLFAAVSLLGLACQPATPAAPPPAKDTAAVPAKAAATAPPAAKDPAAPTAVAKAPAPAPAAAPAPAPAAPAAPVAAKSAGPTRLTMGVTDTMESTNPYAHSGALLYSVWCEVYGCLVGFDGAKSDYAPAIAESWKVENPTTWIFNLNRKAKWLDGTPVTAADVVYSIERIKSDPESRQQTNVTPVSKVEAVDEHTVRITTKEPTSSLLDYFSERITIVNKAHAEKLGANLFKEQPLSAGAYKLKEFQQDQRIVLEKNPDWWGGPNEGPDEMIYRVIREDEVRVTALLNGEIQINKQVPPHMADRLNGMPNVKVVAADSAEIMFLAVRPDTKPWDNKLVRQALAYAIDRDAIIKGLLQGQARRLDGPINPGQYAYDPNLQPKYSYDPARAKQLLAQAGYPDGVDVELSTPVGRYIQDKEITTAVSQMLTAVGIRTKLLTPDYPTLSDAIMKGQVPFYYTGRGGVVDPGRPLSQFFETGVTPRVGYSNPHLDELFSKERSTFDPEQRKKVLSEVMSFITEEAPAHFMWTHKILWGMANNVEYSPRLDDRIFAREMRVK